MFPSSNNSSQFSNSYLTPKNSELNPTASIISHGHGAITDVKPSARECFKSNGNSSWPPNMEEVTLELPCKHKYTDTRLFLPNIESIQCHQKVDVVLSCGHTKSVECYESSNPENIKCNVDIAATLKCGHVVEVKCGVYPVCTSLCKKKLECGHSCGKMCVEDHSHERKYCTANCSKQLICGHYCAKGCANPNDHTERCLEKSNYRCSHGYSFPEQCWKPDLKCLSPCPYVCEHFKCSKLCFEKCDRPACNSPCKKTLSCYHDCSGLCGEPCPPCHQCHPDKRCSITLRKLGEFGEGERSYILPECKCVFSVDALDSYFNAPQINGENTSIRPLCCPFCSEIIYTALRYNGYIKTKRALLDDAKTEILEKEKEKELLPLTDLERKQIIEAMNAEVDRYYFSKRDWVGGNWFICEDGHPYYIGDHNRLNQVTRCPECGVLIGGSKYKNIKEE